MGEEKAKYAFIEKKSSQKKLLELLANLLLYALSRAEAAFFDSDVTVWANA